MNGVVQNEMIAGFLSGFTILDLFKFFIAIGIIVGAISFGAIKIYNLLEKYRATRNELEEKEEMLRKFDEDIKELKIHDQRDFETIVALNDKINKLFDMLQEEREHNDTNKRDDLKDRIAQRYRKFHNAKQWTEMDKEGLIGLIRSYERCGGDNSFVHSVVEKEMYTWVVIDEE